MRNNIIGILLILIFSTGCSSNSVERGVSEYVEGNYEAALRVFKPLAEQGNAQAQYWLGVMYEAGRGVSQDEETAEKWFTRSAKQGDAQGQFALGMMIDTGRASVRDSLAARNWYLRSAEQGNRMAMYNLAHWYKRLELSQRDDTYAYMWFGVAASLGVEEAPDALKWTAKGMTPEAVSKAKQRAKDCIERNYKGCEPPLKIGLATY